MQEQLALLNKNQEKFQQSFVQTVQYIDKNGVLKKIEKQLGQVNEIINKILETEKNGSIEKFVRKQEELVQFLAKNNFADFINSIDQALYKRKKYKEKDHRIILAIIAAASISIVFIAGLILYKINQAEKQHYT